MHLLPLFLYIAEMWFSQEDTDNLPIKTLRSKLTLLFHPGLWYTVSVKKGVLMPEISLLGGMSIDPLA